MYIADVIAQLRARDLALQGQIHALAHTLHMVEVYLSEVSNYPHPGRVDVSRETAEQLEIGDYL